jgi:hypothetical protein
MLNGKECGSTLIPGANIIADKTKGMVKEACGHGRLSFSGFDFPFWKTIIPILRSREKIKSTL